MYLHQTCLFVTYLSRAKRVHTNQNESEMFYNTTYIRMYLMTLFISVIIREYNLIAKYSLNIVPG